MNTNILKFILPALTLFVFSCQENDTSESVQEPLEITAQIEPIASSDPNAYNEYYENGQLKIEGTYDENKQRTGLWVSYYENGIVWSKSYYLDGKKNGHSITFFPSGKVRYVGEYKDDEMSGNWTFKDEQGNVVDEKTY